MAPTTRPTTKNNAIRVSSTLLNTLRKSTSPNHNQSV